MDIVSFVLLCITVILSVGRNIFSKGISEFSFGNKKFYLAQAIVFLSGAIVLFPGWTSGISYLTLIYSVIYAVLLLSAQWCYTAALKNGNTGICSTIYSFGFILPTLSGSIFWNEELSFFKILGILIVIPAIIISGIKTETEKANGNYIIPVVVAMLSSGGLGIMQKVQQNSAYPDQKSAFVLLAFLFAGIISLVVSFFAKDSQKAKNNKKLFLAILAGICFGCCNLLNTTLAGRLDSALFFPMQNISVILLSLVWGALIFKEKLRKKDGVVLLLAITAIIILNL